MMRIPHVPASFPVPAGTLQGSANSDLLAPFLPFFGIMQSPQSTLPKETLLMDIILYLLQFIQYQHKQICWLINLICRYIPLKQWLSYDSHSPKYQKFKIDELPKSYPISRTGTGKTLSLTTSNATTRPFALYFVELSAIYPNTALALPVMCLWTI